MKRVPNWLRTHFPDIDKSKSIESRQDSVTTAFAPAKTLLSTNHSLNAQNKKLQQIVASLNGNLDLSDSDSFTLLDQLDVFQESVETLVNIAEQLNAVEWKLGKRLDKVIKLRAFDVMKLRLANKGACTDKELLGEEFDEQKSDFSIV
jgi:hypothetical protein